MLTLDRIMGIAREHAHHCCNSGDVSGENHNIQVLSVAIQEALSENDDNEKSKLRDAAGRPALRTDGQSGDIIGRGKTRPTPQ